MPNQVPESSVLIELYKIHAEEIRFQLKLNSDRTQYFLVFDTAILGAALTLLKGPTFDSSYVLISLVFLSGAFVSEMAINAIRKGREYYRRTVLQRARVELLLGLHEIEPQSQSIAPFNLTLESTSGQAQIPGMLSRPDDYLKRPDVKRGQVNWYIILFLRLLTYIHLCGMVFCIIEVFKLTSLHPWFKFGKFDIGLAASVATGMILPSIAVLYMFNRFIKNQPIIRAIQQPKTESSTSIQSIPTIQDGKN